MRRLFRTFLLWLLIAILPVQAIAATTRSCCSSPAPAQAMMAQAGTGGKAMPEPHAGKQHAAQVASMDQNADDEPCRMAGQHKGSSCHACANCCVGAHAPPPLSFDALPTLDARIDYFAPTYRYDGPILARIERPPRLSPFIAA